MTLGHTGYESEAMQILSIKAALTALKYTGLVLGTASILWGLFHELSTKHESGRKALTRAGFVAASLTLAALGIALLSATLETIVKQQDSAAAQLAEVARTQSIIMSAQPLRSLVVRWTFPRATSTWSDQLEHELTDVRESLDDDEMKYMDRVLFRALADGWKRRQVMYPWMNYIAGGSAVTDPVLALIPLDQSAATYVPIGLWSRPSVGLAESALSLKKYRFVPYDVSLPAEWSATGCS